MAGSVYSPSPHPANSCSVELSAASNDATPAPAFAAGSAVVYDVRSHGYYDPNAVRIAGSLRLDPNALNQEQTEFPPGKIIYVYCT